MINNCAKVQGQDTNITKTRTKKSMGQQRDKCMRAKAISNKFRVGLQA